MSKTFLLLLVAGALMPLIAQESSSRPMLFPLPAGAASPRHAFVIAKEGTAYFSNPSAGVYDQPFLSGVYRPFGFSEDGAHFLYLSSKGNLPGFSLFEYDLATGADRAAGPDRVLFAAWAPAGLRFAYLALNGDNKLDLFIQESGSSDPRLAASGMLDPEYLEWSADGGQLSYAEFTPIGPDAFHEQSYERRIRTYGSGPARKQAPRADRPGLRATAASGGNVYATLVEASRSSVQKLNPDTGELEEVHAGDLYAATDEGIVVRELTAAGAQYTYLSSTAMAPRAMAPSAGSAGYEMPFQGSAYLVQGGALFSNGACDGSTCLNGSHRNLLGYALDWQQAPEDGMGNTHVLAIADGTVVATYNTVTCNSVSNTCVIGYDNYSSTCSDPNFGAGNYVIIAHADGSYSLYGHLKSGSVLVSAGQTVLQGDHIADQGHSGSAGTYNNYHGCGDHLHLQRQTSGVVWGQSVATDFGELSCNLTCGTAYVSQNAENTGAAAAFSIVLAPTTVAGGTSTLGNQVILNAPAPAGGAVVTFSSSSASTASPPASVTVPAGAVSAPFTITTTPLSAATPVTISAAYNGDSASAQLTVGAVGVGRFSLPAARIPGATPLNGIEIDLTSTAPPGGTTVTLTSSDPSVVVPSSVVVPANATFLLFNASTLEVASTTIVTVTASAGGLTRSATVYLDPLVVSRLNSGTNPLGGGNPSSGIVVLSGAAPPAGTVVNLASSDPSVSVPASITVPGGNSQVSFPITSSAVTANTNVVLTASYKSSSASAGLTVSPIVLASFTLSPTSVIAGKPTGQNSFALTFVAPPGGAVVSFTSSDPAAVPPATITMPAGSRFSPNFAIQTNAVSVPTTATITASYAGSTKTGTLTINPVAPASILINASTVGGGDALTGNKVTLNSAAAGDAVVQLSSSDPATATVPASMTIANGLTAAMFTISSNAVTSPRQVIITATYNGVSQSGTLTVNPIQISALTLSTGATGGGVNVTGNTVTLNYPAPPGGAAISLSSSNSTVASVPAMVTVAQNATVSPAFTINTTAVTTSTPVTISATYAGGTSTATITVNPPAASAITLQSAHIAGGLPVTATVSLTGIAPAGGASVTLTGSNPAAMVPASITVAAGATTSPSFTVNTTPVSSSTPVSITAAYGGATAQVTLTVDPTQTASVTLSATSIGSGNTLAGNTVTLNGPAPSGGAVVTLTSSNASVASAPASVTVPGGATVSPAFSIATTAGLTASANAMISATYGPGTASATLTVNPIALTGLTLGAASVGGGGTVTGTLTLNDLAVGSGSTVTLSSSDPSAAVPPSVTIPAGSKTAMFNITTSSVANSTAVTITAALGPTTLTAGLTVTPPALSTMSIATTRTGGGLAITPNSVALNGPAPAAGAFVTLSSSDSTVASVPASVTVPAGSTGPVSFDITTYAVTSIRSVVISASYGGVTKTVTITVEPIAPTRISLQSTSVGGGNSMTTNVLVLTWPAPAGGLTVNLTSSQPSVASVQSTVTVAAGQTISPAFTITTPAVTASTSVTITASVAAGSASIGLTVFPIVLSSLAISPATVTAGVISSQNSVTINTNAPPGGAVVSLTSSDPSSSVPATVTIPAGATYSPKFWITTGAVSAPTTATITASYGGVTKTGTFTVNPIVPTSVPLAAASVGGGNTVSWNKVNISSAATSGGVVVNLTSSDPSVSVPASVTVPPGAQAVLFDLTTANVTAPVTVTITASCNGRSVSSTFTVFPIQPAKVNLASSTITGGTSTTGTVTLNSPVPANTTISLSSSDPGVTVPATVGVGVKASTSSSFTITTTPGARQVTITATYNGGTASAVLTLQ